MNVETSEAGDSTKATAGGSTPENAMCSGMCTHFHVSTRKNEEYIKHLEEEQKIHSFERDGVATAIRSPHGNPVESVHVIITGKVQGVHFLPWAREQAKHMTINGWIRYVKDGSIEAVFSGKPASVDRMLDRCKTGPGYAKVTEIVADACDPPPGAGFQQLALFE
ncbi:hypothetical protein KC19_10G043300 [Ceratodon purpureus]|uniref:Acylphosphatase-like domain-containing protein n=1 Tax=Ceratodon purpureus TaxID=3225 RepID=A0A8T0GJC3_CERPU|nr:hypothetical protein KC19_10G043300 [Ceratodon purpureus]